MKIYYQILGVVLLFLTATITSTAQEKSCSFPIDMGKYYQENPDELAKNIAFMKKAEAKRRLFKNAKFSKKANKYNIPVVIHN